MKITFLGTGTSQGIPIIACTCDVCKSSDSRDKRLRCSVLIETEHSTLVIDTGPDFRQQMLRAGVMDLDAVLFTHEHKDHTAGLDDIRPFNFLNNKRMDVFCDERVEKALRRDFYYAFEEPKYPGVPEIDLYRLENKAFTYRKTEIIPVLVYHHKLPVYGFRIGDFAYITDANFISEAEKQKLLGCKVLVLNALRKTTHISHFNLEEALAIGRELKPEKLLLTHLSHQMGKHADLLKILPDWVEPAFDEMVLEM